MAQRRAADSLEQLLLPRQSNGEDNIIARDSENGDDVQPHEISGLLARKGLRAEGQRPAGSLSTYGALAHSRNALEARGNFEKIRDEIQREGDFNINALQTSKSRRRHSVLQPERPLKLKLFRPDSTISTYATWTDFLKTSWRDIENYTKRSFFFWLDVTGTTEAIATAMQDLMGLHPVTVEDIVDDDTPEKLECFDNYYFVSFRSWSSADPRVLDLPAGVSRSGMNVGLAVYGSFLLSFHPYDCAEIESTMNFPGLKQSPEWFLFKVLYKSMETFPAAVRSVENEVDAIDELLVDVGDSDRFDMLRRIARAGRNLSRLLQIIKTKRQVFLALLGANEPSFLSAPSSESSMEFSQSTFRRKPQRTGMAGRRHTAVIAVELRPYIGELLEDASEDVERLAVCRNLLSGIEAANIASIHVNLLRLEKDGSKATVKVLVAEAAFLPMMLLCALFSQNFPVPWQASKDGPVGIQAFIVLVCACCALGAVVVWLTLQLL